MLVLTRRPDESIVIGNNIKITIVSVGPGRVKIGIEAPPNVRIDRQEIHDKLERHADVLSALAAEPTDAQNTMVGHAPDTAVIVQGEVPLAEPVLPQVPPPASATVAANDARLSKYKFPRNPR
jgi:carbon storage regulator